MRIADSLVKSLTLGKIDGGRRRGCQRTNGLMASLMQWTWTWANFGRQRGTGTASMLQSMGSQRVGHNWATEQWATVISYVEHLFMCFLTNHISSLEKYITEIFCPFVVGFCCYYWVVGFLYVFWILTPYQIYHLQIFSPIAWVAFSAYWLCPLMYKVLNFDVAIFSPF